MKILIFLMVALFTLYGCQKSEIVQQGVKNEGTKEDTNLLKATFAGGCFWCYGSRF